MPLARALSKLGILSRAQAVDAILAGRVRVDGRIVRDPGARVVPERAHFAIDDRAESRAAWRTLVFHKPRGVVTTRSDPEGRPTVYDVLGEAGRGLVAAGRLDLATTGLLILTTDTQLANWLTDPANAVPRTYVVTVRGAVSEEDRQMLTHGIDDRGERLRADVATVLKTSNRESQLIVELSEGKNREIRRLFAAIGHGVTRLKRIGFGRLALGDLQPGQWRELSRSEARAMFPAALD